MHNMFHAKTRNKNIERELHPPSYGFRTTVNTAPPARLATIQYIVTVVYRYSWASQLLPNVASIGGGVKIQLQPYGLSQPRLCQRAAVFVPDWCAKCGVVPTAGSWF